MRRIGYARVSTQDQEAGLQVAALKKGRCSKIFVEKASGTRSDRPKLQRCLKDLSFGDVLVVWKLDRLARSLRDLIALLDDLRSRGVGVVSLTEAIDTASPAGRAMWQMIGVIAEFERSLIQERTSAGRAAALDRGVRFGRPPKLTPVQIKKVRLLVKRGIHPAEAAALVGVSKRTIYRVLVH